MNLNIKQLEYLVALLMIQPGEHPLVPEILAKAREELEYKRGLETLSVR